MTSVPWLSKRISTAVMLKHWAVSILGNLTGAVAVVLLLFLGGTHASNGSAWGLVVLTITRSKVGLDWHQAFFLDRKSTRLNSSHVANSYAVFCLKKKKNHQHHRVQSITI